MIRTGKQDGWLDAPQDALDSWASFNGVLMRGVTVKPVPSKGLAVIACSSIDENAEPLMTVPRELVLSIENIVLLSKADRDLREVLEALGDFGKVKLQ